MHNLVRAYAHHPVAEGDDVAVFTSSWKDRPDTDLATELGAHVVDRRVPVRVLNYAWHRLEWPPIEMLGVTGDIVHAAHPLLIPSTSAAQVVTVHDLFFLTDPESTRAEVQRDYPDLAASHVQRADAVVANSHDTASHVERAFGVDRSRIFVCSPGPPAWQTLGHAPNIPKEGYVLFVGTLETRKNVGVLLDAYTLLVERDDRTPPLVLAGRATPDAASWLDRISRAPLAGRVRHLGYVPDAEREATYAGARLLVMPSRYEGFGIPVLEAMSAGVPVVAANRGALPEVLGNAGTLVDPDDADALADAIHRSLTDDAFASACAQRGLDRAREFSWEQAALTLHGAYEMALANRRSRGSVAERPT